MRFGHNCGWLIAVCAMAAGMASAQSAPETVLHSFGYFTNGANPYGTLFRAADGTLFGTTWDGGSVNEGVVYTFSASAYKVLYSFKGGNDGATPYSGVTQDSAGNLYGTTYYGGGASNAGVVYKIDASGQEAVLYAFTGGTDGGFPYAGVALDSAGNLYGTTYGGGISNCTGGCGVVYEISPSGRETVLYAFTGGADGANPYGGVTRDDAGNLFGTTYGGGANSAGVVYELSASGQESVLHAFSVNHGFGPTCGVVRDAAGNLYGSAFDVVYKLSTSGEYKELGLLAAPSYGSASPGNVVLDGEGNLYGTTNPPLNGLGLPTPYGLVYKIDTAGQFTKVYRFPGPPATGYAVGTGPNGGLAVDSAGNVYGTTPYGGLGGSIYEVTTAGDATVLHNLSGAPGGTFPWGGLIMSPEGNLYGTADGGTADEGVLYELNAAGKETVLHTFAGGVGTSLTRDSAGNLYGEAGAYGENGSIFRVALSGDYTDLYNFTGGDDGTSAIGLVVDPAGNIYGAASGGADGYGLVFELDRSGYFEILHTFSGGSDGSMPNPGLILDSGGNLYGTTYEGGIGTGVIYKMDASGEETVLYSFNGTDGGLPLAGVIFGPDGSLFGTTNAGGIPPNGGEGEGVIFKLEASGQYTVLYTFDGGVGGGFPAAGVVRDSEGNLYGTTPYGGTGCGSGPGSGCGVVFRVDPEGHETVLHAFTGYADGDTRSRA